jgi:hypothetical protein
MACCRSGSRSRRPATAAMPIPPPARRAAAATTAPANAQSDGDHVNPRAGLNGQELRLIAGGLASGTPGLHTNRIFEFGMPKAEIVAAVAAICGPPTVGNANYECGAGPMEFTLFGPLTLNFMNGRLVGWSLMAPRAAQPIEEEYRLGIGTARAHLGGDDGEPARVEETVLGTEFDAGGIHGLLGSDAPDGVVTYLWAGTDRQFR